MGKKKDKKQKSSEEEEKENKQSVKSKKRVDKDDSLIKTEFNLNEAIEMKYLGIVVGSAKSLFQGLNQKDYKISVYKDGFKLIQMQSGSDSHRYRNSNMLQNALLITKRFNLSDERKLKEVWRTYVDANNNESIKYEWSSNSQEAAVIFELKLFRINIYSFNEELVNSIDIELKDILKEIDNTKRNIAGLDRLIPKYYESKIKKILEKLDENKYKLKSSKENKNKGYCRYIGCTIYSSLEDFELIQMDFDDLLALQTENKFLSSIQNQILSCLMDNCEEFKSKYNTKHLISNYNKESNNICFTGSKKNVSEAIDDIFDQIDTILQSAEDFDLSPYIVPDESINKCIQDYSKDGLVLDRASSNTDLTQSIIKIFNVTQEENAKIKK